MHTALSIPLYHCPQLTNLSRIHNSIYGYDQSAFYEVDLKHSIVWTHHINEASISPLLECKYVDNCTLGDDITKEGYICMFDKKVQKYSFFDDRQRAWQLQQRNQTKGKLPSATLLTSNSMSSFTNLVDAYRTTMVFTKLHHNHLKYSLNWLAGSQQQKKVIKLLQSQPQLLKLNRHSPQVIYTTEANEVRYFDLQKPQVQTTLVKKSIVLTDQNYLYSTASNLVSKFNDVYDIQTVELHNGKQGFSFKGDGLPKKIQTFGNYVVYMSDHAVRVYDRRKGEAVAEVVVKSEEERWRSGEALRTFGKRNGVRVNDFLVEANLGRIYVSLTNELRVVEFGFF